jgi:ribosome maturation factor RimP
MREKKQSGPCAHFLFEAANMQKNTAQLGMIIEPAINALGFEFVGCELVPNGGRLTLRVYIDKSEGVTIDDCSRASHQISAVLDVEDALVSRYDLEVSSPGYDRLLVTPEHYQRFIGKRVRIKLHTSLNERRNFTGQLLSSTADTIDIEVDGEVFTLNLSHIEKANLVPEY